MKKIFVLFSLVFTLVFLTANAHGQGEWKFSIRHIAKDTFEIMAVIAIDEPWHIYSQQTPEGGPLPTKFSFTKNPLLKFVGKVQENGELHLKHEEAFGVDVYYYDNTAQFTQRFIKKGKVKTNITGAVEYMLCTDQQCLPPATKKFTLTIE